MRQLVLSDGLLNHASTSHQQPVTATHTFTHTHRHVNNLQLIKARKNRIHTKKKKKKSRLFKVDILSFLEDMKM